LREEDIVARFDERLFGVMMPDITGAAAREAMEGVTGRIAARLDLECACGLVVYRDQGRDQSRLLAKATKALEAAFGGESGMVDTFPENGSRRVRTAVSEAG
jgi:GGDEF domain-containing protein